jgi:hypothetical protein
MSSKLATRHIRTHNKPLKTQKKPCYPQVPEKPPRKENEQPQEQLQVYARVERRSLKIVAARTRMQETSSKLKSRLRKSVNKTEEKRERARG